MTLWMVRAGRGGHLFDSFRARGVVAVGWPEAGDIASSADRDAVADRLREAGLDEPNARQGASVLIRMRDEVSDGDHVMTFDVPTRTYAIGRISGPLVYRDGHDDVLAEHPYQRGVDWFATVHRDDLSSAARHSLGALATLFRPSRQAAREILDRARGCVEPAVVEDEGPTVDEPGATPDPFDLETLEEESERRIQDRIGLLDDREMEHLVAGLLRAMGYQTQVSDPGPDRGADVLASPDGFGFTDPRIVVEVKHRVREAAGAPMIRSFLGGRRPGERGLFVSTGGFTREARYEAERANIPLKLMTLPDLVSALVQRYDDLDAETRSMLGLTRIYWPRRH